MAYLMNVGIATTRLLNTVLGGTYAESTSSHAWRKREHPLWSLLVDLIDWAFFHFAGVQDHCRRAYESDRARSCDYLRESSESAA